VVAIIENGEKWSYAIRQGDVFVAPAGTINYLANTDGRRKLIVTKILHTISVPGQIQARTRSIKSLFINSNQLSTHK
jgi:hypothetical protein